MPCAIVGGSRPTALRMVNGPVRAPDRQNHRRKDNSLTWVGGLSLPDGKTTVGSTLDVEARRNFWKVQHERLSTYVPDDDRSRIEAALARRVPPPTAAGEAA